MPGRVTIMLCRGSACRFMGGFNYVPLYCRRLGVLFRQRDHRFYRMLQFAVASELCLLPLHMQPNAVHTCSAVSSAQIQACLAWASPRQPSSVVVISCCRHVWQIFVMYGCFK